MKGGVTVEYLLNLPYSLFLKEAEIIISVQEEYNAEVEKYNAQTKKQM